MMVESLSSDELKEVFRRLEDAAKCSSCLSYIKPPVTMCVQGHLMCSGCLPPPQLDYENDHVLISQYCPDCGSEFSDIKCVHMNTILSILSERQQSECNNALCINNRHCSTCDLRSTVCCIVGCNWKGIVKTLLNHVQQNHNIPIFENKNCSLGHFTQLKQICTTQVGTFAYPMLAHGCFFWKHTKIDKDEKKIFMFLTCVPTSIEHLRMVSVIKFGKNEKAFAYSQKVYSQDVDIQSVFKQSECISVPFSVLDCFVGSDGKVKYTCEIFQFDKASYEALKF